MMRSLRPFPRRPRARAVAPAAGSAPLAGRAPPHPSGGACASCWPRSWDPSWSPRSWASWCCGPARAHWSAPSPSAPRGPAWRPRRSRRPRWRTARGPPDRWAATPMTVCWMTPCAPALLRATARVSSSRCTCPPSSGTARTSATACESCTPPRRWPRARLTSSSTTSVRSPCSRCRSSTSCSSWRSPVAGAPCPS